MSDYRGAMEHGRNEAIGSLDDLIAKEIEIHGTELKGKSGKGTEWEEGFKAGMEHVRANLLPTIVERT